MKGETETLNGIARYVQKVCPYWQAYERKGFLFFDHKHLSVKIEVLPGDGLVLLMQVRAEYGKLIRVHTWLWDEVKNPSFITNDRSGLTDEDYTLVAQLLDEVSCALLKI